MTRHLQEQEKNLLKKMLTYTVRGATIIDQLDSIRVESMNDCGMGSLKFVGPISSQRQFGAALVEAEFLDKDDVPVFAVVNLDRKGNLYELDIWKVDFSALIRWPDIEDVSIKLSETRPQKH